MKIAPCGERWHWRRAGTLLCLLVCLLVIARPVARGQAFINGSITGNVLDSSGVAVPGVQMTLVNIETGTELDSQSDSAGQYRFLNLPPGNYTLTAASTGFSKFTRTPIHVQVSNAVRIDVTLQVGSVSQNVTVTGETPLLQPSTSSLGQVIEGRAVTEMPLNGRNPMALVALVPGVVPQSGFGQNTTTQNIFAAGNVQINGGLAIDSMTYWDGAPLNNVADGNAQVIVPTQDAIQEFKVMTDNLPAEYGRFSGGVISFSTKTGTNQAHGQLYEYLRNKVLNANNYFNVSRGVGVPNFTQNQFGGNFGGPVILPHFYDGKDRTFFFVSYDAFRLRQGEPLLFSVPTAEQRAGDFSQLGIPIYDPATTKQDPVTGTYTRTQISCNGVLNVICPQNIDPTAAVLEKLWQLPNTPSASGVDNWAGNGSTGGNAYQLTIRGDEYISNKQRLFARYTTNPTNQLPLNPFGTGAYPGPTSAGQINNMKQGVVGYTYTFSPTAIADFTVGALRQVNKVIPQSLGYDLSKLGPSWAGLSDQVTYKTLPSICVSGITDFCGTEATSTVIIQGTADYTFDPNFTLVRGRHIIKFGGDYWVSQYNEGQTNYPTGIYSFTEDFTASAPLIKNGFGGYGFASFLLGDVYSGTAWESNPVASQIIYRAAYIQDTFRLNSKLTLNMGLRYSLEGSFSERHHRDSVFLPDTPSPLATPTGLPLKGYVALVDSPQHPGTNAYKTPKDSFEPRFGFAYQINPSTVLRGGYGMFHLPTASSGPENPTADSINSLFTSMTSSVDGGFTPYNRLSNPFPQGIPSAPGRNPDYQSYLYGNGAQTTLSSNPYTGYVQQWNLDIQRELPGGMFVDAAYAASRGTHLPGTLTWDQLNPKYMSLGESLYDTVPNPFYGAVPASSQLNSPTVTRRQLLIPFPQFGNIGGSANWFTSHYDSLQAKGTKRFEGGQTLLVSYTLSRLIADTDAISSWLESAGVPSVQNSYDLNAERSAATFDVPQRLVISYVLDLPFGRGRKYLGDIHGIADKVISGWGVDGITTFQNGFPLFFGTQNSLTGALNAGSRPNFDSSVCPHGAGVSGSPESRLNQWFNTSCFSQPAPFTFGNVGRTFPSVRTDGIHNFDFAAFKGTTFGPREAVNIQFRAEFFNLFNHPQFGYPGMTLGTPQFGIVSSQANLPRLIQFGLKLGF